MQRNFRQVPLFWFRFGDNFKHDNVITGILLNFNCSAQGVCQIIAELVNHTIE